MRLAFLIALFAAITGRAAADPFADAVVAYRVGTGGGAGDPALVLGPPRGGGAFQGSTDTFSLGLGGSIVLTFTDNVIVDGLGADFTVFENAFLTRGLVTGGPFAEPGTVAVSADGVNFFTFPCRADEAPYYPGCAGVYPVFADARDPNAPSPLVPSTTPIADLVGVPVDGFRPPPGSGGDSFDLATVGLGAARFVRIDASDLRPGLAGLSGFDLDAVAAVHSIETAGLPDSDNDGFPDIVDNCPTLANADQLDGDHDGIGDACDSCPGVPNPNQEADACGALGDCDADNDLDLFDVLYQIDIVLGRATAAPKQRSRCDDTCDGAIDIFDVVREIDALLGRIPTPLTCPPRPSQAGRPGVSEL